MNTLTMLFEKDRRILLNLRRLAREQSVFKGLVVGLFGLAILAGLFFLFLDAFGFLGTLGGIGLFLIRHLFGLFFFGLGVMLILSNIITAYAALFRSADVAFLLLKPIPRGVIALYKLFESALLSSWAFFLIMIPFVAAFARHQHMPLSFAFWTIVFSIPFVLLCAGIGVILTVILAGIWPRLRGWRWAVLIAVCLLAVLCCGVFRHAGSRPDNLTFMLTSLVPGIKLASFPLWPSWWVSEGILAMARWRWERGALLFGVLSANLLFVAMWVEIVGDALFYRAWERIASSAGRRGITKAGAFTALSVAAGFLPQQWRAIILKDVRSFLRDPVQLIQSLLFFGLLGIYFLNLRNLHYHLLAPVWRNLIAFLNLFSLATIMCSFCSRFIFPQISLEGHAFWITGLSPLPIGRVLKIKYVLSVLAMLSVGGALMVASALMLAVEPCVLLITIAVTLAMSFALCGLALGLGAIFLDLRQANPVAIISGFGGTLNLVLSLLYIMAAIFPFAFICHARVLGHVSVPEFALGIVAAGLWLVVVTFLTSFLPLLLGRRSLERREY